MGIRNLATHSPTYDNRPIGLFDSGIGGLTVLKSLHQMLPEESFIYLGDTARLPYGSKSPETIDRYLRQNIEFLARQNIKAVVVACNSASTVLLGRDLSHFAFPVYNVIEPGAQTAIFASENQRIGVLGTKATITSGAYALTIQKLSPRAAVFSQACPLLVPLVEEGWEEDPLTNLVIHRYVHPLMEHGIDALILGCTHYPVLKNAIQRVTMNRVTLVDSSQAIAEGIQLDLTSGKLNAHAPDVSPSMVFQTTDVSPSFLEIARRLMSPLPIPDLQHVDIGLSPVTR